MQEVTQDNLSAQKIDEITNKLFFSSPQEEWKTCNTVIVLGSYKCKYRIERAFELFTNKVKYIVCGGNLSSYRGAEGFRLFEAEFMKNYLIQQGVLETNIYMECISSNTKENVQYAYDFIKKYSIEGTIGIVSGGFHLCRVKCEAERIGLSDRLIYIPAYGLNTHYNNWFKSEFGKRMVLNEYEKVTK